MKFWFKLTYGDEICEIRKTPQIAYFLILTILIFFFYIFKNVVDKRYREMYIYRRVSTRLERVLTIGSEIQYKSLRKLICAAVNLDLYCRKGKP